MVPNSDCFLVGRGLVPNMVCSRSVMAFAPLNFHVWYQFSWALGSVSGQFFLHLGLIWFLPILVVDFCDHCRGFLPQLFSLWSCVEVEALTKGPRGLLAWWCPFLLPHSTCHGFSLILSILPQYYDVKLTVLKYYSIKSYILCYLIRKEKKVCVCAHVCIQ